MKKTDELLARFPELSYMKQALEAAVSAIVACHLAGGKILLCGNGGSAADCEHIAGELQKGFLLPRLPRGEELTKLAEAFGDVHTATKLQRGVAALPLPSMAGILTAFVNDVDPELVFAQQVYAIGRPGDVLIGLSTSGKSKNVVAAVRAARALGLTTVALTGRTGGTLASLAEILLPAPAEETYRVQEYHLPIYHALCAAVEEELFGV